MTTTATNVSLQEFIERYDEVMAQADEIPVIVEVRDGEHFVAVPLEAFEHLVKTLGRIVEGLDELKDGLSFASVISAPATNREERRALSVRLGEALAPGDTIPPDEVFEQRVIGFIERYRPALEALAQK